VDKRQNATPRDRSAHERVELLVPLNRKLQVPLCDGFDTATLSTLCLFSQAAMSTRTKARNKRKRMGKHVEEPDGEPSA
jgi:hypothetical protein